MVVCLRCSNETRTSALVTAGGQEILLAGTMSQDPQPISAQVCVACGFIQLFAPQPFSEPAEASSAVRLSDILDERASEPVIAPTVDTAA